MTGDFTLARPIAAVALVVAVVGTAAILLLHGWGPRGSDARAPRDLPPIRSAEPLMPSYSTPPPPRPPEEDGPAPRRDASERIVEAPRGAPAGERVSSADRGARRP